MGVYLILLPTLMFSLVGTSRAKWDALGGRELLVADVANVSGTNHETAEQFQNVNGDWLTKTEGDENIIKEFEETIKGIYGKAKGVVSDSDSEITTVKEDNQDRIPNSTKYGEDGDSNVDSNSDSDSHSDSDSDSDSDSTSNDSTIHWIALTLAILMYLIIKTLLIYRCAKRCNRNRHHDVPRRKMVTVTTLTPIRTGPNSDRVNLINVRQTRILHV